MSDIKHRGRVIASNGYVLVRVGKGHHLADVRGYAYEHRVVAEATLGRRLQRGEQVHHRDENKQNNAPDNLEVLSGHEHRKHHRIKDSGLRDPGERNPLVVCACGCGTSLRRFDASGRPRDFVTGHNGRAHARPSVCGVQLRRAKRGYYAIVELGTVSIRKVGLEFCVTYAPSSRMTATLGSAATLQKAARLADRWLRDLALALGGRV